MGYSKPTPYLLGQTIAALLQAEDRLLQISDSPSDATDSNFMSGTAPEASAGSSDLKVHHLKPPSSYVAANWPLQNAALSPDGVDIAVAGRRGLALYSRRSSHWRLFGDVSQEKELAVHVSTFLYPLPHRVCMPAREEYFGQLTNIIA